MCQILRRSETCSLQNEYTSDTKQYPRHRSTDHANNTTTPNPNRHRGNAGATFSPSGQDCPAHPRHKTLDKDPEGLVCPHQRPITKPQHKQSAGHEFHYRQGMEQFAPALHSSKSPTEGRRDRCQFRTLGNAHGTSYDRRDDIKLQKVDEQSRDNGNMANRVWKGFRRHGTRGQ